jgi:hypothetical protein
VAKTVTKFKTNLVVNFTNVFINDKQWQIGGESVANRWRIFGDNGDDL